MAIFSGNKIQRLVQEYESAANLEYNFMANKQVAVVRSLCEIGSKDAIDQVARFMVEGKNHEYMDFAIPDTLALHLKNSKSQIYVVNALMIGMLHGQNEILQKTCLRKLVEVKYTPIYKMLIEYRNFLLSNHRERPLYWRSILTSVTDAATTLNPYVDESMRISSTLLMSSQLL